MSQPLSSCKDKMNPIHNWVIYKSHPRLRIISHGIDTLRFLSKLKSDNSFEILSEIDDDEPFPLCSYTWNEGPSLHNILTTLR